MVRLDQKIDIMNNLTLGISDVLVKDIRMIYVLD